MKTLVHAMMIVALPVAVSAQTPLPVGSLIISAPSTLAELDMAKLKGEPSRLAWSADGNEIYLQTIEGPFQAPKAVRHYVIGADGKAKDVEGEPAWFSTYWTAKSDRSSPDSPGTTIELQSENRIEKTTSVPRGGDLARGGTVSGDGGSTSGEAVAAASNSQTVTVHTMKLLGQAIGEFTNSVIVPGMTFAWGPRGSRAIAYAQPKGGKLVLMGVDGKRQEVDGTKDSLFPMWSSDGTRLAWLQRDGKKRFELKAAVLK